MHRLFLALLLVLASCSHAATARPLVVKASDTRAVAGLDPAIEQPVIVEFQPGDTIPFDVTVDGDLVGSPAGLAPIALTAKRAFWLRISKDGASVSLDGVNFNPPKTGPGTFRFGVGVDAKGPKAELHITTPQH